MATKLETRLQEILDVRYRKYLSHLEIGRFGAGEGKPVKIRLGWNWRKESRISQGRRCITKIIEEFESYINNREFYLRTPPTLSLTVTGGHVAMCLEIAENK